MYEDAQTFFRKTLTLGPNLVEAWFELGRARWFPGDRAGGSQAWTDGQKANKFNPWAKRCQEMLAGRSPGEIFRATRLVALALSSSSAGPAPGLTLSRSGQVVAVAWPPQLGLAASLADEADRVRSWPGLGQRAVGPIRLILVPDEARYHQLTGGRGPSWGAGIALPGSRTILIRADAGDLSTTLRHELAHLVLHGAIRTRVPRWFDEGYAAFAAGEWDRVEALSLNLAVARGGVPDLRS